MQTIHCLSCYDNVQLIACAAGLYHCSLAAMTINFVYILLGPAGDIKFTTPAIVYNQGRTFLADAYHMLVYLKP